MKEGPFTGKNHPLVRVENLMTPNDFSQWPIEVARSKAVEALIQQNDDLMARLSVQLRRISALEEELNTSKQNNERIQFHYDNIKDQLLILKQKAQALAQRKDNSENIVNAIKDKVRRLEEELRVSEIRYTELYQSHEEKQNQLLKRIDQHARRVRRFLNYRERIQKASQNLRQKFQYQLEDLLEKKNVSEHNLTHELKDLKNQLEAKYNEKITDIQNEHHNIQEQLVKEKISTESLLTEKLKQLETQNTQLSKQLDLAETTLRELRAKLAESTDYIQKSTKEYKEQIEQLEAEQRRHLQKLNLDNENEIKDLKRDHQEKNDKLNFEIEKLQRENQKLFDKCTELEKVYEENVQLQNKIVFVERNRDEQKNKFKDEIEMLQRNLSHYRADSKSKASILESMKSQLTDTETLNQSLKEEKLKLEDQVESTQSLWRDSQKEIETLKDKNLSLQKLNQQLSATINQSRKDQRNLKEKFETLQIQMTQKIKELRRNSETVNSIRDIEKGEEDFSPELTSKLETLIAEIQSGFIRK
ncbi:MAG: hypothetical protein KDD40_04175 [Bdellovibrionales bacterium]|nr:hypothetical protein [Bdellovibrionales bacterium]